MGSAKDKKGKAAKEQKRVNPAKKAIVPKTIKLPEMKPKGQKGNKKKSILVTLLAAFMVPVILMITLGIVSYNTASSGIVDKYKESAESTVSAVGDYFDLVCDNISGKALEMITNSDVGDYYDKYYGEKDSKAMEAFRNAKSIVSNAKSTNRNIYSCTIIPEGGGYLSTISGGMTDTPMADFGNTAEGQYFINNNTQRNKWLGYQTYLDSNMQSKQENYALVYYQRLSRANAYVVMAVDMSVAEEMLGQIDFGKDSVKALVSSDGREVSFVQMTDSLTNSPAEEETENGEVPEEETAEQAKLWFVGSDFYESTKEAEETGHMDVKIDGKKYVYIFLKEGII